MVWFAQWPKDPFERTILCAARVGVAWDMEYLGINPARRYWVLGFLFYLGRGGRGAQLGMSQHSRIWQGRAGHALRSKV